MVRSQMSRNQKVVFYIIFTSFFILLFLAAAPISILLFIIVLTQHIIPSIIYNCTTSEEQKLKDELNLINNSYNMRLKTYQEYRKRLPLIKEKKKLGIDLDCNDYYCLEYIDGYNPSKEYTEYKKDINNKEKEIEFLIRRKGD